jgi:hypothetical protein
MIYRNMLAYRRAPTDLFVGSESLKASLWAAIQNPSQR